MVLNDYRERGNKYLDPVARRLDDVDPNTITWFSLLCAFLGGFFIWGARATWPVPGVDRLLWLGTLFIFANSYLDALDGKVAKMYGKSSKRGDFLDHVVDRYADLFILLGITFSAFCDIRIGLFAIVGVLTTSYMGTQAQALGAGRNYGGILGRADRMVILTLTPLLQYWLIRFFDTAHIGWFTIFEWVMLWFAVAGSFTAVHRGWKTWQDLGKKG